MTDVEYMPRLIEPRLAELLRALPAILLLGPRATGKTTTASRFAETRVQLDRPAEAVAFRADPDAALRSLAEPVLLDDWQVVPQVLGAVKRSVDADPSSGRFLLTGSVRSDLETDTWPGTGRLIRLTMYGFTNGEREGRPHVRPLVDRVIDGTPLELPPDVPDLRGYVESALRSGYPEPALRLVGETRETWLASYFEQLTTRDAVGLVGDRDPDRLRRYAEAYALHSAGVIEQATLLRAAGIARKTADAYQRLLVNLFVADEVPAWRPSRLKRLTAAPKRYIVDPGLMATMIRADAGAVMRDGTLLGRLLETLVMSELRAQAVIATTRPRLFHLREKEGRREVDVVCELAGGDIVGIEVKADAAPDRTAARHLEWLRDALGERFAAGLVLHTGPRIYPLAERVLAAPICALWGTSGR